MAMTFLELARFKKLDDASLAVVDVMQHESDILKILPMLTNEPGDYNRKWRRANALPSVAFRARGERFTETGVPSWEEGLDTIAELGTEINIDIADYEYKGWSQDPLQYNIDMKVKSIARLLHDYVINGDLASDEDSFDGLNIRVQQMASGQTVYGVSSSSDLDVTETTLLSSNANAVKLLGKIDEAKEALDGRTPDYALCDYAFLKALKRAYRILGLSTNYGDMIGTPSTISGERETSANPLTGPHFVDKDGCKYIAMGLKRDQSTKVIADQTIDSVACSPVFYVKFGGNYVNGMTNHVLSITPFRLTDDEVNYRSVIRQTFGLTHTHPKSIAVLRGVQY